MCGSSNSWRMTSHALIARRRSQTFPRGCSAQQLLDRRPEAERRELAGGEDVLDLVVLVEQPAVGVGVARGVARDLLDRALAVEPRGQVRAVRERDVRERVRVQVLEPVAAEQPELVVDQQRVGLDQRVAGRARVDRVARAEQLLGCGAAARDVPRVEHQHLVAGDRQVGGGDQAVVAGAGDDDLRVRTHPTSLSALPSRIAASASLPRPAARTVASGSGSPMSNGWSEPATTRSAPTNSTSARSTAGSCVTVS